MKFTDLSQKYSLHALDDKVLVLMGLTFWLEKGDDKKVKYSDTDHSPGENKLGDEMRRSEVGR